MSFKVRGQLSPWICYSASPFTHREQRCCRAAFSSPSDEPMRHFTKMGGGKRELANKDESTAKKQKWNGRLKCNGRLQLKMRRSVMPTARWRWKSRPPSVVPSLQDKSSGCQQGSDTRRNVTLKELSEIQQDLESTTDKLLGLDPNLDGNMTCGQSIKKDRLSPVNYMTHSVTQK